MLKNKEILFFNMDYYQVMPKKEPGVNGAVLRMDEKSLEVFAGESNLSDFNLNIRHGQIRVDRSYSIKQISEEDALKLRENFEYWKLTQAYVANDSYPESILSNTPGTRENALMRSRH